MVAQILLTILLIVLLLVLGILLVLYLVPIVITVTAEMTKSITLLVASVSWGIVGVRFRMQDEERKLDILLAGRAVIRRDLAAEAEEKPEKIEEKRPPTGVHEYLRIGRDLWPDIRRILDAVLQSIRLERCVGEITLGLASPADTGRLYGYATALRYALWPAERIDLILHPVFCEEVLEGKLDLRVAIRHPLTIIVPIVSMLLKKPVRERLRIVSGRGTAGA